MTTSSPCLLPWWPGKGQHSLPCQAQNWDKELFSEETFSSTLPWAMQDLNLPQDCRFQVSF